LAKPGWTVAQLAAVATLIAGAAALQGVAGIGRNVSFELLAQRIERDSRAELYSSLLGKSQTFHSRQRVGHIMASSMTAVIPLVMVAFIDPRLLLVPCIFIGFLALTVWEYNRRLNPATD